MIDRTADAPKRMKQAALKTRDTVQINENQQNHSPTAYASEHTENTAKAAAGKAAQQFQKRGLESVKTTQENIKKAVDAVQLFKEKQTAKTAKSMYNQPVHHTTQSTEHIVIQHSARQTITYDAVRQAADSFGRMTGDIPQQLINSRIRISSTHNVGTNHIGNHARDQSAQRAVRTIGRPGSICTAAIQTSWKRQPIRAAIPSTGQAGIAARTAMHQTMTASQQGMRNARHTIRNASDFIKAVIRSTASAFRITVGSTKALLTALLAGAWLSVMIIFVIALFGGAMSMTGGTNGSVYTEVSEAVQAYEPLIRQYAVQYGIPEYVELIKAVMMQESGGEGSDPMQAAEGAYNTKYPKVPNGILDPDYSIQCGVQELKSCLQSADVQSPVDIEHISLALQGYNFGKGYISWAVSQYGGYSAANAQEFSNFKAQKLGWSSYGDPEYVPHVLRYYPLGRVFTGGSQAIVEIALSQIGNVGGQPYWSWYGFHSHVQWCACFVSWCADQCGYIDAGIIPKHAACQEGADWFRSHGQWQSRSYVPAPGDIIYFDWNGDGHTEHVGIVEKTENGTVYTVEGNASNTCAQRHYPVGSQDIYGYGIPVY